MRLYANLQGFVASTACTILHLSRILAKLQFILYNLRHKVHIRDDDSWNQTSIVHKKLRTIYVRNRWKSECVRNNRRRRCPYEPFVIARFYRTSPPSGVLRGLDVTFISTSIFSREDYSAGRLIMHQNSHSTNKIGIF